MPSGIEGARAKLAEHLGGAARAPGPVQRGPWACLALSEACAAGMRRWLLVRRDAEDPDELAFFLAYGPEDTTAEELLRVCATRWQIEEGFAQAKGEVGLDQYEVRTWDAWHRFVTLCLLAHAYLVVMRLAAQREERGRKGGADPGLIPLTVPEVRRLLLALGEAAEQRPFRLALVAVAPGAPGRRRPLPRRAARARPGRARHPLVPHRRPRHRVRADRRRVGSGRDRCCRPSGPDRAAAPRPPHRPRRDPLGRAHPRLLAGDALGVRQVGDRLQALPALVRHRPLAAHPCGAGPKEQPKCRCRG